MPATEGRHAYVRKRARLDAPGAFEFFLGPLDDVVELLLALRELRHHHGVDRLVVDLGADIRAGRRAGHRGLLVTARRVAINGAGRRTDGLPGIEGVTALERR